MALPIKLDPTQMAQFAELTASIGKLSQVVTDLILVLGGTDSEAVQQRIDQIASTVRATKDKLQTSVDSQTKGD